MAENTINIPGASQDFQTIEDFVNLPAGSEVRPRLLPSVNVGTLAGTRDAIFEAGGLPATPFATKALMTSSTLIDGKYAQVTDDTTNNGLYIKTSGAWVKSDYDPLSQAKADATVKADAAKTDALAQVATVIYTDSSSDYIVDEVDTNGTSVRKVTKDGKHFFVGLGNDLVSAIGDADQSDLITTENTDNIFEYRDSNGVTTLKQDANGDLISLNVGNITQAIRDLQTSGTGSSNVAQKGINVEAAHLAGKYNDFIRAENVADYNVTQTIISRQMVWDAAIFTHNTSLIRIPAMSRIGKSKYLVCFEGREDLSDFANISVASAVVDIEPTTKAVSVSNIKLLHHSFTDELGKLRTFMNPCTVKLDSGKIIALYARRQAKVEHQLYMKTSNDDAASWSAHTDITSVKGSTGWNLLCPCSQGLVKRYGQHKGRVVFPLWTTGKAYVTADFRAGYIYSDDDGLTWELGEFAPYATANEVQIAEDLNGDMLFSIRLENRSPPKIIARHSDITKEFVRVETNKPLTDETIMSGFIQGENKYDRTPTKFVMSTCNTADRKELLLHTSYTGGKEWVSYKPPSTINIKVAYSCIESLDPEHIFTIWESEATSDFSGAVISINNLIEGI